jgi:hypothetical protein
MEVLLFGFTITAADILGGYTRGDIRDKILLSMPTNR